MRRWLAAAALAALGCDTAPPSADAEPPAAPDAAPTDVEPPDPAPPCSEPMASGDGFTLTRCADRATFGVTLPDGRALRGLGPWFGAGDAILPATGYQLVTWRPADDGLTIDYRDQPGAPDATVTLRFDGPCLRGALTVIAGEALAIDAAGLTGDEADAPGRWTLGADARPAPSGTDAEVGHALPRLWVAEGALVFGALDPARPLWTASAPRLHARLAREAPIELAADEALTIPWALCAAMSPIEALDALGARIEADAVPAASARITLTRAQVEPDPEALAELGARLSAALGSVGHLHLADGWAADRAEWRPLPEIAALPATLAPATVGLDWPALALEPDDPLVFEQPDWLEPGCAAPDTPGCPRLDPRVPEVREHLARQHLALRDAGFAIRLVGLDHLPPSARRALLGALAVDAAAPEAAPPVERAAPPVEAGLAPVVPLAPASDPATAAAALALWSALAPGARVDPAVSLDPGPDLALRLGVAIAAGRGALADPATLDADPATPTGRALAWWRRALHRGPARPLPGRWFTEPDPAPAPPDWRAADRLILLNWTDRPRTVERPLALAPDLAGAPRLLADGAPLGADDAVVVPPRGAVIWATVDGGPAGE